jgi:hypothetical protein
LDSQQYLQNLIYVPLKIITCKGRNLKWKGNFKNPLQKLRAANWKNLVPF